MTRRRRRPSRRNAFTVIELLTVIGILIIIAGILVYGANSVIGGSKRAQTKTTLEVLRSMVSEFEVTTKGLNRQPAYMWATDGTAGQWTPPANPISIWRDGLPTDTTPASPTDPEPDAAKADQGAIAKDAGNARYEQPMIGNTQLVMGLLLQAAGNKKLIDQTSTSQLMEQLPVGLQAAPMTKITIRNPSNTGPQIVPYDPAAANRNPSPPVPLDGWGNPIIFVPAGGLWDVYEGDVHRGRFKGEFGTTDPGPVKSPDGRPFWASAGPDGHFGGFYDKDGNGVFDAGKDKGYGDDNIYSFGN